MQQAHAVFGELVLSVTFRYTPTNNQILYKPSLVPRPHPLMRRNGLVNQIEFLRLAGALATV